MLYRYILRPLLFCLDEEQAHKISLLALKTKLLAKFSQNKFNLKINIANIEFPNPLGLAAGYDKNGEAINPLLNLGFSHIEIGTITPKAQSGNAPPRLFRIKEKQSIINRLGFNNKGSEIVTQNIKQIKNINGILGINIGANKNSENFIDDYIKGIKHFGRLADYLTINISSPNTKGLRDLQNKNTLQNLLAEIKNTCQQINLTTPIFLKISPDITDKQIDEIATSIENSIIKAVIISNTTISRDSFCANSPYHKIQGGLSGVALFDKSTKVLAKFYNRIGNKMPLIGAGGISNVDAAWQKMEAGASLIQLYTGLVYFGPKLVANILVGLDKKMQQENISDIKEIVGRRANLLGE